MKYISINTRLFSEYGFSCEEAVLYAVVRFHDKGEGKEWKLTELASMLNVTEKRLRSMLIPRLVESGWIIKRKTSFGLILKVDRWKDYRLRCGHTSVQNRTDGECPKMDTQSVQKRTHECPKTDTQSVQNRTDTPIINKYINNKDINKGEKGNFSEENQCSFNNSLPPQQDPSGVISQGISDFYQQNLNCPYIPHFASHTTDCHDIYNKIGQLLQFDNLEVSDTTVGEYWRTFLRKAYNCSNSWMREHFSLTNINRQFSNIITQIKNHAKSGPTDDYIERQAELLRNCSSDDLPM